MATSHVDTWGACLLIIEKLVSESTFNTWFRPIKPVKLADNVLTVEVPSDFFCSFLEDHYLDPIKTAIQTVLGAKGKLEYQILHTQPVALPVNTRNGEAAPDRAPSRNGLPADLDKGRMGPSPFVLPGMKTFEVESNLNLSYTFDNLVEGECNRLARSAGFAVANKPGVTAFNPLFIYSSVGLGKTHLLQAIGNYVRQNFPRKSVLYVPAEQFTTQFVENVRRGTVNDFMNFYQHIDVLLVDDIQYMAGKEKTQDNFFHIFNHLRQNNHQIVLASDRQPNDLEGLEDRLISRFRWGLTAELKSPDFDTRREILKLKMESNELDLPEDVVDFISDCMASSVRDLEGALINLMAQSTLNRREVDLELARLVVSSYRQTPVQDITIDGIQRLVSEAFEVTVENMKSAIRLRQVVQARQVAMYFAKEYTAYSLKMIGRHFGNRDHSTVIHALQTVRDLMTTDKDFRRIVTDLRNKLHKESGR